MRAFHRCLALAGPLALLFSSSLAQGGDAAAAQALFNDARKLMTENKWAEACPKLEESQRLDPGMGTEFNLANCHEHIGRIASAWAEFLDVVGTAKASGQPAREKAARERAAALEPKLSRLTITVQGDAVGEKITRDGNEVGRAQWGSAVPVDPGQHTISASAPGKKSWEKSVRVTPDAKTAELIVPLLAEEPVAVVAPVPIVGGQGSTEPAVVTRTTMQQADAAPEGEHGLSHAQRNVGLVLVAVGVVGMGIGTGFGIASKGKHDDAKSHCVGNQCDSTGVALREDALHAGTISTVAFVAGAGALVTGAVLWLTAPTGTSPTRGSSDASRSAHIQASPLMGPGMSGVTLRGTW